MIFAMKYIKTAEIEEICKMQKQSLRVISIALLLIAFFTLTAQAFPTAYLELLDSNILVGESFDVNVWADGDGIMQELLAFGFDVSTTGGAFSYDGYTIQPEFYDDSSGSDNVSGSAFPSITNTYDVLLAKLSFNSLSEGTGNLTITGYYNSMFSGLYYEDDGFDIFASTDISV